MAKTKLTPKITGCIISGIKDGNYAKIAAEAAGIDESTYYKWLKRGEDELLRIEEGKGRKIRAAEEPFVQFFQSVTQARGEAEASAVKKIKAAGEEDWRAVAWFLERRYSSRWANTQRLELQVREELESALDKLEASLDSDTFEKVAQILAGDSGD